MSTGRESEKPTYFATPATLRGWLMKHHQTRPKLWVGFHKKGSGKASITWPESVDEALCYGWIDGVRKRVDDTSYKIRFTPRTARSKWSAVNIKRARELTDLGRMRAPGRRTFAKVARGQGASYSYEDRKNARLNDSQEKRLRANTKAWTFFQTRPPSNRRAAVFWIVSAKKPETRERRLTALIRDSAQSRTIGPLTRAPRT